MDVFVEREGQCFVWDSDKARSNLTKHGLTFDVAIDVFSDPFAVFEDVSVPEERREAVIGRDIVRRILFVVHTDQADDCIRVISARKALRREVRLYEEFA